MRNAVVLVFIEGYLSKIAWSDKVPTNRSGYLLLSISTSPDSDIPKPLMSGVTSEKSSPFRV